MPRGARFGGLCRAARPFAVFLFDIREHLTSQQKISNGGDRQRTGETEAIAKKGEGANPSREENRGAAEQIFLREGTRMGRLYRVEAQNKSLN